jgi:hypothetical protein
MYSGLSGSISLNPRLIGAADLDQKIVAELLQ